MSADPDGGAALHPNLVLFMPDQLRADALGCFGNPHVATPNIDALASRGTRFTNAFAQNPVSLLPVLADPAAGHRRFAFSEGGFLAEDEPRFERPGSYYRHKGDLQHEHPESVGKAMAVRTPRWTFIDRLYEGPELYDRDQDPGELVNLAGRPAHESTEGELRDALYEWLFTTSDVVPWAEDPRQPEIVHGHR